MKICLFTGNGDHFAFSPKGWTGALVCPSRKNRNLTQSRKILNSFFNYSGQASTLVQRTRLNFKHLFWRDTGMNLIPKWWVFCVWLVIIILIINQSINQSIFIDLWWKEQTWDAWSLQFWSKRSIGHYSKTNYTAKITILLCICSSTYAWHVLHGAYAVYTPWCICSVLT